MLITHRTRGRSLSPGKPIPVEEGSDQRAANTRASVRVGRGLAVGDVCSRRLWFGAGASHHDLAPRAQVRPLGRPGRRWEVTERATRASERDAGSGVGARRQVRGAANSPNLLHGWLPRATG